ncbi:HK97 family phage prohead protease [Pseudovibrio sp. SCP19]|uniref:HK97 family phage prohead protease n=1 Tax=Pseudovibrio sp. SCP19 TaxID=3141374 RepID=UPI00333937F5
MNTDHPIAIEGYASRFELSDQGGDVMRKGAFHTTLQKQKLSDVKMLWQHDPAHPIGKWLHIQEDSSGLFVKGLLYPGIAQGRQAIAMVQAGILDGLSIGFKTRRAQRNIKTGRRDVLAVDLWEISLVTFPLLPSARLTVVS